MPHGKIEYRRKTFEEMDTEAVLRRRPSIALVDELAHTNVLARLILSVGKTFKYCWTLASKCGLR